MSRFVSNRREIKYLIDKTKLDQFDRLARPVLELDKNNPEDRGYYNYTIYFDSPDLMFWREKNEGLRTRVKPRLRIYKSNIDEVPTNYFLEFKHRQDNFISKERLALTETVAQKLLDRNELTDDEINSSPVLAKFHYLSRRFDLLPQVCVLYHRFAYSVPFHHRLRITYDTRLQCSRNTSFTIPPEGFEYIEPPRNLVIEIKYNKSAPSWLINICSRLEMQAVSYSKYAEALEHAYLGGVKLRRLTPD